MNNLLDKSVNINRLLGRPHNLVIPNYSRYGGRVDPAIGLTSADSFTQSTLSTPLIGALATSILPLVVSFVINKMNKMNAKKNKIKLSIDNDNNKKGGEIDIISNIVNLPNKYTSKKKDINKDAQSILNRVVGRGLIEV